MAMKNYSKLANVNAGGVPENEYNKLKERYGVKSSLDNYTVANALNANKIDATNNGGDTTGLVTPLSSGSVTPLSSGTTNNAINNYNQFLQESLDKQNANVEAQRANDLRQAQINYQLMMKYLPEQVKYSGLGNDGNSAQFYLNAQNQYQNNLANINSNADQTLNNNYANYYRDMATRQATLDDRAYKEQQETKADLEQYASDKLQSKLDENGKLTDKAYNEYINYINEDETLTEIQKQKAKNYADLQRYTDEEETTLELNKTANKYGATIDEESFVDVSNAGIKSFGSYHGTGKGGKQDKFVKDVIAAAKNGTLPEGSLIDFNYGVGALGNVGSVYLYSNGKFYKTNLTRKQAEKKGAYEGRDNPLK